MASHVQVILTTNVENLGQAGTLVKVKPGYARNYLLPRSMAVVATRSNIKQVEHERRLAVARAEKERQEAQGHAAQLENVTLTIAMQAGEGDKLFGSVTSRDIADGLAKQSITVDRKRIVLEEPIKTLGDHKITVKFASDVVATFTVSVVKSEA